MFFYHNGIEAKINNKNKGKSPNTQKLNNIILNNTWLKEVVPRGI